MNLTTTPLSMGVVGTPEIAAMRTERILKKEFYLFHNTWICKVVTNIIQMFKKHFVVMHRHVVQLMYKFDQSITRRC